MQQEQMRPTPNANKRRVLGLFVVAGLPRASKAQIKSVPALIVFINQPIKDYSVPYKNFMSDNTKGFLFVWGIAVTILFAICAFSQFTIEVDEWSTLCRAAFGIGAVGLAILVQWWIHNEE